MLEQRSFSQIRPPEREAALAYDPSFDERDYRQYRSLSPEDQKRLRSYTKRQFETYLGERDNVVVSTSIYEIRDGKMYGQGELEPFENVIQRGIEWRRNKQDPNPVDFGREQADLIGYQKTQKRLTSKDTKPGAINVVASLKGVEGSDYQHNFIDVFTLKEKDGKRVVEAKRYTSSLTLEEAKAKFEPLHHFENDANQTDLLLNPVEFDGVLESAGQISKYLGEGVDALEEEEFNKLKQIVAPLLNVYVQSLIDAPYDFRLHRINYNAVLNKNDFALDAIRSGDLRLVRSLELNSAFAPIEMAKEEAKVLGMQRVKEKIVPCGKSGGFDVGGGMGANLDPYTAADFGKPGLTEAEKAKKDPNLCKCGIPDAHFHCPGKDKEGDSCSSTIEVGKGITKCLKCGEGSKC